MTKDQSKVELSGSHHISETCKHLPRKSYTMGIPVMSCVKCFKTLGAIPYSEETKEESS